MEEIQLLERTETTTGELATGTVVRAVDSGFMVKAGGQSFSAACSASCLLEPEPGDLVLAFCDPPGESFILSVLRRTNQSPAKLSFANGVSLRVGRGALEMRVPEARLACEGKLRLSASDLEITADKGSLAVKGLSLLGEVFSASYGTLRLAARRLDQTAERLTQRFGRSYRRVDQFEESKIGRLRTIVRGAFYLKSASATLRADKAVKVDGERVMLG